MGLDLYRRYDDSVDRSVQLWFLRAYADIPHFGDFVYAAFPSAKLVRLLPHGEHDAGNLPAGKPESPERTRKEKELIQNTADKEDVI